MARLVAAQKHPCAPLCPIQSGKPLKSSAAAVRYFQHGRNGLLAKVGKRQPSLGKRGEGDEEISYPGAGSSSTGAFGVEWLLALLDGPVYAHPRPALGGGTSGREILLEKRLPHPDHAAHPRGLPTAVVRRPAG